MSNMSLRQELVDWGVVDATDSSSWERAAHPARSGRIRTPGKYVHILRKMYPDLKSVDGRLLAAVWRNPAIKPWDRDRLDSWLDYWFKTQPRPKVVGSVVNDYPDEVARAWSLGINPEDYPLNNMCHLMGESGHRRIAAVVRLGRKGAKLPMMKTADLVRMSKFSGAFLRYLRWAWAGADAEYPGYALDALVQGQDVDWECVRYWHHQFNKLPQSTLRSAGVPANKWHLWDTVFSESHKETIRIYAAAREAGMSQKALKGAWKHSYFVNLLKVLIKRGWIGLLANLVGQEFLGASSLVKLAHPLEVVANMGAELPVEAWKSWAALEEALDAFGVTGSKNDSDVVDDDVRHSAHQMRRKLDRYAQKNPDWAIRQYLAEYQRGERVAEVMRAALTYLCALIERGEKLVIHGRDGELLYCLLRRMGFSQQITYVISSRPLTTQASEITEEYREYLGKMVPEDSIHVDTGFAGSIPAWMNQNLSSVKGMALISATNPDNQMPIPSDAVPGYGLRECVLSDLEHSAQRLDIPRAWGKLTYSASAPGFWARLYGVCDALGLPRKQ